MKIELNEITVRELVEGYEDDGRRLYARIVIRH